jgi:aarF domain-containing kinase
MPSVAKLIAALPEMSDEPTESTSELSDLLEMWSTRPVPVGRFRRLRVLGTLQAKIAAAYLFYWLRGFFKDSDENQRLLTETHWKTAVRVLDSMSYLRGAVMKVGQTLANFPDVAAPEFVETLQQLHFRAPPMHWSLLREMVFNELGDDPENLFAEFDQRPFAAASLGQVHRARLKSGEEVAVKIQYPGIARTIRQDFRNLLLLMFPARLTSDWESTRQQMDDLRTRLELETDYEREAATLQKARALFREDDGIVVPRVFPQFSTARVLTMERLDGVHLTQFVESQPAQAVRNEFGRKVVRAWYRMLFAGRMMYADYHPGNFLFMENGRLGVIDFGFMVELDDGLWDVMRRMDRALTTGRYEDRVAAVKEWCLIGDDPADQERLRVSTEFADSIWKSRYRRGDFDFGEEAGFRRAVDLFAEMVKRRYSRALAPTISMTRCNFGVLSMLYQLKAKVDVMPLAEEEVRAAGWDRNDYAPAR